MIGISSENKSKYQSSNYKTLFQIKANQISLEEQNIFAQTANYSEYLLIAFLSSIIKSTFVHSPVITLRN